MKSKKRRRREHPSATATIVQKQPPQTLAVDLPFAADPAVAHRLLPALIVLITFIVFLPVLNNGFVDLDNRPLTGNPGYRGLGWTQLRWMVADFHFGQYQPLAWITLALDYLFWWADPFGHHLTNLLFHVVNAALFYYIACELLRWTPLQSDHASAAWVKVAAGVAALLFAVHPLRVESVAWASARGEIAGAAFLLLSVCAYLKIKAAGALAPSSARWMILSVGAFLFSLLASPSALVLPAILLILDRYPLGRLPVGSARFVPALGRLVAEKAAYFFLGGLALVVAILARNAYTAPQPAYQENFFTWIVHQLAAPAFYLCKTILPINLAPAYELSATYLFLYIAASGLLCGGAFALRKRWAGLAPACLCYLILLLPLFRDQFPAQQLLADRYTYLASLPVTLGIGVAAAQSLLFAAGSRPGNQKFLGFAGLTIMALGVIGGLAWRQIPAWRDAESLWSHAANVNPTSRAYFNLATLAEAQSKYDDAIAFNRRVVEIDPSRWEAHERAAVLLQTQGKIAEAIQHYRAVLRLNPNAAQARENLAGGLIYLGEIDEAIQHFRKVLELAPERNEPRFKLGTVLALQGRLGEAEETLTAAAQADPHNGRIRLRLGQVLASQGKLAQALPYFHDAVRLLNEDAEAHENLGRGLLELGRRDEAAKHLQEALRIMRSRPTAR